ncbi:hypothetical protein BRADI_1g66571v3 [Brachypodium distachyon]|uniref:Uncharacterized protein n=1 Tax=Brachypodium distachyon TaxID=15368 RepID=A0A0Q3KD39_BRADI|nr:hypothetical protein BRADI_1g66571v3 [Brachypodium distachyon]
MNLVLSFAGRWFVSQISVTGVFWLRPATFRLLRQQRFLGSTWFGDLETASNFAHGTPPASAGGRQRRLSTRTCV